MSASTACSTRDRALFTLVWKSLSSSSTSFSMTMLLTRSRKQGSLGGSMVMRSLEARFVTPLAPTLW